VKNIFLLLTLLTFTFVNFLKINAQTPTDQLFSEANSLYQSGEFEQAIEKYEKITDNNIISAELFYNLGGSYYKLGNIGKSILNYERALKMSPNDEDILFNLNVAKLSAIDKIDALPKMFFTEYWHSFKTIVNSNVWSWISILFIWIFGFSLSLFIISQSANLRKYSFLASFVTLFLFIISFISGITNLDTEENRNSAIIMNASTYAKSSPEEISTDLFILHEGTKVEISDEVAGWLNIRLGDGNKGWVKKESLERI
jgi:tetratricopeptide (TPR) repeat protein